MTPLTDLDVRSPAKISPSKVDINLDGILDCSSLLFSSNEPHCLGLSESFLDMEQLSSPDESKVSPLESITENCQTPLLSPSKALKRSQSADSLDMPCSSGRKLLEESRQSRDKLLYGQKILKHKFDFWVSGPPNLPFPFNRELVCGPKSSPAAKSQRPPKPPRVPKPVKPANIFIAGQEGLSPRHQVKRSILEAHAREGLKPAPVVTLSRQRVKAVKKGKIMTLLMALLLTVLFGILIIFQGSNAANNASFLNEDSGVQGSNLSIRISKGWRSGPRKGGPADLVGFQNVEFGLEASGRL